MASDDSVIPSTYEDILEVTPIGSVTRAVANHLTGINHRQIKTAIPKNKDRFGLTFFTRPQLNLSTDNIKNIRKLYSLLTASPLTIQRFVRCTLDPRLAYGLYDEPAINTPLVDPLQAFIPVLTNSLNTISGWPGIASPTYTSKEGLYKEQYSQVDGIVDNYSVYTLDASYSNLVADPIIWLFHVWSIYQSAVFEGLMVPYFDFIPYNRIDYNTRVYRLILSNDMRTVTKIAATGASFPINDPSAELFDFNTEKIYNSQSDNITIRFQSMGAQYLDDILVDEFNRTTMAFNPMMKDEFRSTSMVEIPADWLTVFNNKGYPRIDPDKYTLGWWVTKDDFKRKTGGIVGNELLEGIANV